MSDYFYAILFEEKTGKILLIEKNSRYFLPGGEIIEKGKRGWIKRFCCRVIPEQTNLGFYYLEETIKSNPSYFEISVDGGKEKHSAVIVGQIGSYMIDQKKANFYGLEEVKDLAGNAKIDDIQQIFVLHGFASKECCSEECNRKAVPIFKELLKRFLSVFAFYLTKII